MATAPKVGSIDGEASTLSGLGFDTDHAVTQPFLQRMQARGYGTAIRYYRNTPGKGGSLTVDEMLLLKAAGFDVVAVYQHRAIVNINQFSYDLGKTAGTTAYKYAADVIRQPLDSAIYFAADFNPSSDEIAKSIMPYFDGVRDAMASLAPNKVGYGIGVYGSGRTCGMLLQSRKVTYTWLSQSTDYAGTAAFGASGQWNIKQLTTIKIKPSTPKDTKQPVPGKQPVLSQDDPERPYDPDLISAAGCGAFSARIVNLEDMRIPHSSRIPFSA